MWTAHAALPDAHTACTAVPPAHTPTAEEECIFIVWEKKKTKMLKMVRVFIALAAKHAILKTVKTIHVPNTPEAATMKRNHKWDIAKHYRTILINHVRMKSATLEERDERLRAVDKLTFVEAAREVNALARVA